MIDDVFRALADSSRRLLLDRLNERNGQSLRELCDGLAMTRQSVSKHLDVLQDADLVVTQRHGREKWHYLNAAPINDIADRWIGHFHRDRARALSDLKTVLESQTMNTAAEFVYVTYIKTTPEALWRALTDPAFTRRYWGVSLESDWYRESPITWSLPGWRSSAGSIVLEAEPFRKLSYSWHNFDNEFALATGVPQEDATSWAAEPRTAATFELEPTGNLVKLTVLHTGFQSDTTFLAGISEGWPSILANLKTMLETGEPAYDGETAIAHRTQK